MTLIERYREWYEHEIDANDKMLTMIESVPDDKRSDPKFQRAVVLAAHLAACRDNWLDRMINDGRNQKEWWPPDAKLEDLRAQFAWSEKSWVDYLDRITDEKLLQDFEFQVSDGTPYRWNVEGQVIQLVGHAFYHRGQIALLVDQLGGRTVDTDYLFWAYDRSRNYGKVTT